MAYRTSIEQAKPKRSREKNNHVQSLWFQDKIPPLISISATKQKPNDKLSIDSLNQSEVRSIYTVDKEQLDRNTLQIFNKSFKSQKGQKTERFNGKPTDREIRVDNFETPLLKKKLDVSMKQEVKTPIGLLEDLNQFQYKNCQAVKLYQSLVEEPLKQHVQVDDHFQFQWISSKNPPQLLANVLTNQSRLRLYIHYLQREINKNEQSRYINQIHQEQIRPYNPHLKEVYTNIICILSKLVHRVESKESTPNSESQLDVSIFQNGINIDIDPKSSLIKKRNNDRIRELRHEATQKQNHLQQIKRLYEDIIENYAVSIENMSPNQQQPTSNNKNIPLKESRVHLQVEEDEADMIRKKNHTFGMMKPLSGRSSRQ